MPNTTVSPPRIIRDTNTIGASTIVTALNTTNVNLLATNSITVNAAIDASGNATGWNLTLTAPTANLNQAIKLKTGSTLSGTATTVNVGANGTVQNGIDVASTTTAGMVNLAAATYKQGSQINIAKNVTVKGAGSASTIVSGESLYRVFNINSGNVTLDSLTVTNGKITGANDGGGVNNNGAGTLTVNNSTVSGNTAGKFGGGIEVGNNGGALILTNSTVSGNTAGSFGGGGIDAYNGSSITLINSTVSGNSSQQGGGIWGTSITLTNSTVSANSGGGIFGGGTIKNSIVAGNIANGGQASDLGGSGFTNGATI